MMPLAAEISERLIDCVECRIGLGIRSGDLDSFRKILLARMHATKIVEPEAYLHFLETDTPESHQEWQELVILLTTGESYFFRDKGHFFLLRNTILPELLKNNRQRTLRIWSAGCATGEEPYSVAMLLDMLLPERQGWDIFILGTDINEESLAKARRGLYSPWSFRLMEPNIQGKYFTSRKGDWQIAEEIKKMVHFQCGNLLDPEFLSNNPEACDLDIVICRNVFIYFNKTAVATVLNNFTSKLNDAGYLITGHGELQGHELTNLRQILFPEAVIYQKTAVVKGKCPGVARGPERFTKKLELQGKGKALVAKPAPAQPAIRLPVRNSLAEIEELIGKGRYAEAIARAENCLPTCLDRHDMICLLANAYANSGDYDKAAGACREALSVNADSAEPYFLLAHIAEARGNDEEARNLFRKAIYLNPAFIAAYCELGWLYEKDHDPARAKRLLATAIDLLKILPSRTPVKPYDMTAGELLKSLADHTGSGGVGVGAVTR